MQNAILAYDTEKRLQKQGLSQLFTIQEWVYEAGPAYYRGVLQKIQQAIELSNAKVAARNSTPYANTKGSID